MLDQFSRTRLLLGQDSLDVLARARVAVFGIGGVGGHVAEALARSGVGALDLIDNDTVCLTNVNRQIVALNSTVGRYKVDVMAERIADINPDCSVACHKCFYLPETAGQFDFSEYDYVVDAVDTVTAKLHLIETANAVGVPLISSMGAANKLDPTAFEVADIYRTSICPLAKIIRKECRKRGIEHLKVVYSKEPAICPPASEDSGCAMGDACPDQTRCQSAGRSGVPGSTAFVPAVAGLIIAGEVVKDLTRSACR